MSLKMYTISVDQEKGLQYMLSNTFSVHVIQADYRGIPLKHVCQKELLFNTCHDCEQQVTSYIIV